MKTVQGFTAIEFPPEAGRVVSAIAYKSKIVVLCEYGAFITNDFDRNEDLTLHRVTFSVDQLAREVDPHA